MVQNGSISDAWQYIGNGLRKCVDLGIHVRTSFLRFRDPVLFELHSRVFWSLVFWDRVISATLARPLVLQDEEYVCLVRGDLHRR